MSDSLGSLVGDFLIQQKGFLISGGIPITVATPDPTRWSIIFVVGNSGSNLQVQMVGATGLGNGMNLQATGGPISLTFRDHGSLVSQGFTALNVNASDTIIVTQVLYRPSGPTLGFDDLIRELSSLKRQSQWTPEVYHQQLSELHRRLSSPPVTAARK